MKRRRINIFWRVAYSLDNNSVPAAKMGKLGVAPNIYEVPIKYGLTDVDHASVTDAIGSIADAICTTLTPDVDPSSNNWDKWIL